MDAWTCQYRGFVEWLMDAFPMNEAVRRLCGSLPQAHMEKYSAAYRSECQADLLQAKDVALFAHLRLTFPDVNLTKMYKALSPAEQDNLWQVLQSLWDQNPCPELPAKDIGQAAPQRHFVVRGFNKLYLDFIESLTDLFGKSESLLSLRNEVRDLDEQDPKFLDALTNDIDTSDKIDLLKANDPAVLACCVTAFPEINLCLLFSKLEPSEREDFWKRLSDMFDIAALRKPLNGSFATLESMAVDMIERASRKGVDPRNLTELTTHVVEDFLAQPNTEVLQKLSEDIQQEENQHDLRKFFKLKGFEDTFDKLMLNEPITESDKTDLIERMAKLAPGSRGIFTSLMSMADQPDLDPATFLGFNPALLQTLK